MIGVFDSGYGGLTVLSALLGRLPQYDYLYLGDNGRAPYGKVQSLFQAVLPADASLFNEFHALFVAHGKDTCRSRDPLCATCPLLDLCPTGRGRVANEVEGLTRAAS